MKGKHMKVLRADLRFELPDGWEGMTVVEAFQELVKYMVEHAGEGRIVTRPLVPNECNLWKRFLHERDHGNRLVAEIGVHELRGNGWEDVLPPI
jgi:hypothetical protein